MQRATDSVRPQVWRFLPLGILLAGMVAVYASGAGQYLSLEMIVRHHEAIARYVSNNLPASVAGYALTYIAVVALSLPGAAILSIIGGYLFGWKLGLAVSATSATIGAIVVFLVVRTSLGHVIAAHSGPHVKRLTQGFREGAFSYLLSLRLAPIVPFFAVNAIAGLAGVGLMTFVLATIIGIIPAAIALAWIGSGLESVVADLAAAQVECLRVNVAERCSVELSAFAVLPRGVLAALGVLAVLALVPTILRLRK